MDNDLIIANKMDGYAWAMGTYKYKRKTLEDLKIKINNTNLSYYQQGIKEAVEDIKLLNVIRLIHDKPS